VPYRVNAPTNEIDFGFVHGVVGFAQRSAVPGGRAADLLHIFEVEVDEEQTGQTLRRDDIWCESLVLPAITSRT
jgi:hypothetical protein